MSVELDPKDMAETVPGPTEPAVASQPAAPRRMTTWIAWGLAIAFAITTVGATLAWRTASQAEAARTEVHDAVTGLAINLVTWEAATLDDTAEQLRARGTGEFLDQIDAVIAGAKELSQAVDGSSSGELLDVLVDVDGNRAVAIVVVRQTLRAAGQENSEEQVMRVELVDTDEGWLVDEVELINVPIPVSLGQEPS